MPQPGILQLKLDFLLSQAVPHVLQHLPKEFDFAAVLFFDDPHPPNEVRLLIPCEDALGLIRN